MKKYLFLIGIGLLILTLAACSGSSLGGSSQTAGGEVTPGQNAGGTLPLSNQLALGTFKLEETELAVTPEQAVELLPLWKAARSLSQSDNVTEVEIEAIFEQIQEIMSAEQVKAINEMQLKREDLFAISQEYDLGIGPGGGFNNLTPEQQATAQARRESGQSPEVFGPGMGGEPGGPGVFGGRGGEPGEGPMFVMPGGQEGINPEARQTAVAGRGEFSGTPNDFSFALYEAVIRFLEAKIAATE